MKDQLHRLMEAEGLSPAKFADEIGVQRSSISHIISGRNKPSYDFLIKVLKRFRGINAEWLLTGSGSMIKSTEKTGLETDTHHTLFAIENEGKTITGSSLDSDELPVDEKMHRESNIAGLSTKDTIAKQNTEKSKVTNVNNVKYILVFYQNGEFEQFKPRE